MSLLTAEELAQVRALAESGMSGTATILTRSTVETVDGQESVWATNGDDVPCWVREITSDRTTLGGVSGAVGIGENFSIRIPVGSDAHSGDRLAVGSVIYDVQWLNETDTYGVWLNCICRTVA